LQPLLLLVKPCHLIGGQIVCYEVFPERGEGTIDYCFAYSPHQVIDKGQIVDGGQTVGKQFPCFEKVMQVSS
jgi:hypothetical protein